MKKKQPLSFWLVYDPRIRQGSKQEGKEEREGQETVSWPEENMTVMDGRKAKSCFGSASDMPPRRCRQAWLLCLCVEVAGNDKCPWRCFWAEQFADRAEHVEHSVVPMHAQPQHRTVSQRENNICLHLPGEVPLRSRLTHLGLSSMGPLELPCQGVPNSVTSSVSSPECIWEIITQLKPYLSILRNYIYVYGAPVFWVLYFYKEKREQGTIARVLSQDVLC